MTDAPRPRWFHPKPSWLILGLLLVECLLWLSDRFQWPTWHKGYAVLTAVAAVGVVFAVMLLWLVTALILRRRFQFSIRSLLFAVVVVALPFSWLAVEMKTAREQHDAVEGIMKVGGIVWYDWQVDVDHYYNLLPKAQPPEPAWLRSLLGNDLCWSVTRVFWEPTDSSRKFIITDAGLENLRELKQLQHLSFWGNWQITDAKLEHLEGLNQLRELWLNSTLITDGGLKHLGELTQLHTLALEYTGVTDQGLDSLKGLRQLRTLHLVGTRVTDAGVKKLQQALPKCAIQFR